MSKTVMASRVLMHSGLGTLIRRTSGRHGFVVLNYHRIGDVSKTQLDAGVYSATPDDFERQLQFLKLECDVITPEDIADLPTRGRGNYAIITFDDGYRDNYELALPRLKAAGLKAVFFIATGFVDRPHLAWWDELAWIIRNSPKDVLEPTASLPISLPLGSGSRQKAIDEVLGIYKKLPAKATARFIGDVAEAAGTGRAPEELASETWMTWEMVRALRDAGMLIGGHTVHHPVLANLPRFEQDLEISGCAMAIEKHLGQAMTLFSYPRGKPDSFTQETRACLYEQQVQYAFSYYGGMNQPQTLDPYDVRRVAVDSDTPIEHFEALVTLPRLFA